MIWRRHRLPTITVKGSYRRRDPAGDVGPAARTHGAGVRSSAPGRLWVVVAGPVEESGKAQGPIAAVIPLMLFIMATFLMVQLQSVRRLFLWWSASRRWG